VVILYEAGKPSDLKKNKRKSMSKNVTTGARSGIMDFGYTGIDDTVDYTYKQDDDYWEGYIQDKKGNQYNISAHGYTANRGQIVGGSYHTKIIISYKGDKITFTEYDPGIHDVLKDITDGIYLEDLLHKHNKLLSYSNNSTELAKQIIANDVSPKDTTYAQDRQAVKDTKYFVGYINGISVMIKDNQLVSLKPAVIVSEEPTQKDKNSFKIPEGCIVNVDTDSLTKKLTDERYGISLESFEGFIFEFRGRDNDKSSGFLHHYRYDYKTNTVSTSKGRPFTDYSLTCRQNMNGEHISAGNDIGPLTYMRGQKTVKIVNTGNSWNPNLRAQANDYVHGVGFVRFPNDLRKEGAVYIVDELTWNGKNYSVKGKPQLVESYSKKNKMSLRTESNYSRETKDQYERVMDYILNSLQDRFQKEGMSVDIDDYGCNEDYFSAELIYYPPGVSFENGIHECVNINLMYYDSNEIPNEEEMKQIADSSMDEEVYNVVRYFNSCAPKSRKRRNESIEDDLVGVTDDIGMISTSGDFDGYGYADLDAARGPIIDDDLIIDLESEMSLDDSLIPDITVHVSNMNASGLIIDIANSANVDIQVENKKKSMKSIIESGGIATAVNAAIRAIEGDDDDYRMKVLNKLSKGTYNIPKDTSIKIHSIVNKCDAADTNYSKEISELRQLRESLFTSFKSAHIKIMESIKNEDIDEDLRDTATPLELKNALKDNGVETDGTETADELKIMASTVASQDEELESLKRVNEIASFGSKYIPDRYTLELNKYLTQISDNYCDEIMIVARRVKRIEGPSDHGIYADICVEFTNGTEVKLFGVSYDFDRNDIQIYGPYFGEGEFEENILDRVRTYDNAGDIAACAMEIYRNYQEVVEVIKAFPFDKYCVGAVRTEKKYTYKHDYLDSDIEPDIEKEDDNETDGTQEKEQEILLEDPPENRKVIASYGLSNTCSVNIYDINYGIDDAVVAGINNDNPEEYTIEYDEESNPYFSINGMDIPLSDCMKLEAKKNKKRSKFIKQ